jgi:ABC-type transport system involved in multi-copper enzyme maturation permease subunit
MLGPIFRVELVSIARRRRYFALRVLYASLILMVLWATYESSNAFNRYGPAQQSIQQAAAMAAGFFISFSWLQLLTILFVGPAMAVGTIATERERRTIEYLFVTDLSNSEIVLGKTFARLILMAQVVLVGLPILFLFRLLGGIPAEALLASFLSAAGTAMMLTGLSIAVSVWSPKARDATVRIYLLLIALFSLPLMLYGFQHWGIINDWLWVNALEPFSNALWLINPLATLGNVTGRSFAVGLGWGLADVLSSVGAQLGVAMVSLLLALSSVRRVHLAETTKSAELKPRKMEIPKFRRRLGVRPMLWKEMYSSTSQTTLGRIGWGAILLIMIGVIVSTIMMFLYQLTNTTTYGQDNYFEYLAALSGYLGTGMLLLMAVRAAGLFAQEKERDCWITLLSTPLTGEEMVNGKLLGNLYSTRWLWILLLVSWLLGALFDPLVLYPLAITILTLLLLSVYTTCLGLFFSLRSATSLRAMAQTLGVLVFFGGGYLFCCCIVLSSNMGGRDSEIILAICIPFLIAFPGIAFTEMNSNSFFWNGIIVSAYVIGMFVHLVTAGSLYAMLIRSFEEFSGRTTCAEGIRPK